MPVETTTTEATPQGPTPYLPVARENWQPFFDSFTKAVTGRQVEIEVIGLDLGDQIEAEWLPLNGLTYEAKSDTFYVFADLQEGDLDHAIAHPREIFVGTAAGGIEQVVIMDDDGHKHIIRMREPVPVMLPSG